MREEKKQVEMTAEEAAEFERFREEKAKKDAAAKAKENRATYAQMVDDEIEAALPILRELSEEIKTVKSTVLDNFDAVLSMKADVLKLTKDKQRSHTFAHSNGQSRIIIGRYVTDGWRDTVDDGITIVKEAVTELIKDPETKALVNQILRLLSRDAAGNLKAGKVLQLRKMAEELHNARLNEGITIIEEAYLPAPSKNYIRAEYKDKNGAWCSIPLSVTES